MTEFKIGDKVRFNIDNQDYRRKHFPNQSEFIIEDIQKEIYDPYTFIKFANYSIITGAYAYRLELVEEEKMEREIKRQKKYYVIYPTGTISSAIYDNYDSALETIKELAAKDPNKEYTILETKSFVKSTPVVSVIEVK